MADRNPQFIRDLIGQRHDWTPVAVMVDKGEAFNARLLQCAQQRRWRLVSLVTFNGYVPPELELSGAIVDQLPDHPVVADLAERGIPIVRIGRLPHPDDHRFPAVVPDTRAIGQLAAEHFAERGFKHVAFVGRKPWGHNRTLYEGLEERAAQLGMSCHPKQLVNKELQRRGSQLPEQERWLTEHDFIVPWLKDLPKPLGLLCYNDVLGSRYSLWGMQAGITIPQELAVLCIASHDFVPSSAAVPLSCVEGDDETTIAAALDTLDKLMAGQTVDPTTIFVPPRGVVTRQSTDVLAASDSRVVAALHFMWSHVDEDLSVDEITEHVGVSRSTLEKAFKKGLGRGINTEFQRRRLEKARELVTVTDLPIAEIAAAMSYSSHSYFCQVFKAAFGVAPAEYRNEFA